MSELGTDTADGARAPLRILSTFPDSVLSVVRDAYPDLELVSIPEQGPLPAGLRGDVLLIPPWDPGNLETVLESGIRWIHTLGTGVERMPMDLVGERIFTCSRGVSGIPISEWTLAVMLAFEKQLPENWLSEPSASWGEADLGGLYGRSLGLVGLGGIGLKTAELGLAFGMRVRALRRTDAPSPMAGVEMVTHLDELLSDSDHLLLALPLTAESQHIIDAQALAKIPAERGLHLINVARGGLVDQEALRPALDDGRVARASLDVVDPEPLPEGHWLFTHPRVRLSAHVSWCMPEAMSLFMDNFIDNVGRYLRDEPLTGLVHRDLGY